MGHIVCSSLEVWGRKGRGKEGREREEGRGRRGRMCQRIREREGRERGRVGEKTGARKRGERTGRGHGSGD